MVANLGERRADFFWGFFHGFDVYANVCQSFLIFFCPVPVLIMRIQILNTRGFRKFVVKSSSDVKVRSWRENRKFYGNSSRGDRLRRDFRHGSCAARNVQNQYGL